MGLRSKRIYQYDNANRLTTQIEQNSAGTPIMTMVDTYDNVGNRTARNTDGTRSTYTYDGDGRRRMAQEQSATRTTFIWDGDDYL